MFISVKTHQWCLPFVFFEILKNFFQWRNIGTERLTYFLKIRQIKSTLTNYAIRHIKLTPNLKQNSSILLKIENKFKSLAFSG